jgi:hypothetical protein
LRESLTLELEGKRHEVKWWRKPPDLSLSNEYQELTRGGCINCGALREVLRAVTIHNSAALREILSKMPSVSEHEEGCWAYNQRPDYDPACLGRLKDDDPKVIQARDEIIRARQTIEDSADQYARERAAQLRKIKKRRLP